jgi:hypothetical protein
VSMPYSFRHFTITKEQHIVQRKMNVAEPVPHNLHHYYLWTENIWHIGLHKRYAIKNVPELALTI